MNKDELLKIYSANLPYKIRVRVDKKTYKHHSEQERTGIITQINLEEGDYELVVVSNDGYLLCDLEDVKPILYDLSYLTKPIEHDGVKKILAKELFTGKWKEISEYYVNTNQILKLSYDCIQILLKHHFNVFQLAESEYINKATLTTHK